MSDAVPQQRFALLVGIDFYLRNGTNERLNFALPDLNGCVSDVKAMKRVLEDKFKVKDFTVLTSSPPAADAGNPQLPAEPSDVWPTFDNIKTQFDNIYNNSNPGDIFFFHYSGHGGLLKSNAPPPITRSHDPSIMTADFCNNKSAVRGWQLNEWLKRLNEKKVQVVVVLDSCYSGGAWRNDGRARTPPNWRDDFDLEGEVFPLPNAKRSSRDTELPKSWISNPEGFTLMTACNPDETAAETQVGGLSQGVFTRELVRLLSEPQPQNVPPTYRVLHEKISKRLELDSHKQRPQVFGRDRLAFLDNYEPFIINPVVGHVKENEIIIEMGTAHGLNEGSEFKLHPFSLNTVFQVTEVEDWKCRARIPPGFNVKSAGSTLEVIPSKWGLGEDSCRVLVHSSLGTEFQSAFRKMLGELLAGHIEIVESNYKGTPHGNSFKLSRRGKNGVYLSGPSDLVGYEGPLRGVQLQIDNVVDCATRSAMTIGRLVRFKQVLFDIPAQACDDTPPFTWEMIEVEGSGITPMRKLSFRNTGDQELYLTVLNLAPGFGVEKVWPGNEGAKKVLPQRTAKFPFNIFVPDELQETQDVLCHRDFIRVAVTNSEDCSWKSLELPHIWQIDSRDGFHKGSPSRLIKVLNDEASWWVEDKAIFTSTPISTLSPR